MIQWLGLMMLASLAGWHGVQGALKDPALVFPALTLEHRQGEPAGEFVARACYIYGLETSACGRLLIATWDFYADQRPQTLEVAQFVLDGERHSITLRTRRAASGEGGSWWSDDISAIARQLGTEFCRLFQVREGNCPVDVATILEQSWTSEHGVANEECCERIRSCGLGPRMKSWLPPQFDDTLSHGADFFALPTFGVRLTPFNYQHLWWPGHDTDPFGEVALATFLRTRDAWLAESLRRYPRTDMNIPFPTHPVAPDVPNLSTRDLSVIGNLYYTTPAKLRHDAEQLHYLIERGSLPPAFRAVAANYTRVYELAIAELSQRDDCNGILCSSGGEEFPFLLSKNHLQMVGRTVNTHVYIPLLSERLRLPTMLNTNLDTAALEAAYLKADPQIIVVDDLLSPHALAALFELCTAGTFFFDAKAGYLGAYQFDGFGGYLLDQLEAELRQAFPNVIGNLPLVNAWAYKVNPTLDGLQAHADSALVNLNLWLTPDDANAHETSGGLRIWEKHPDPDWDSALFNNWGRPVPSSPHRDLRVRLI